MIPTLTSRTIQAHTALHARLGGLFRLARQRAGISLRDTARALGVSVNTVRWHENGATMLRADKLALAAACFDCPIERLLGPASEDEAASVEVGP